MAADRREDRARAASGRHDAIADCGLSTTVFAASKKTEEILCYEARDWSSFTVDLTAGPVAD